MKRKVPFPLLVWLLGGALILGLCGPNLVPTSDAALSGAARRIVKRLQGKIKHLKRQLAIARTPAPPAPTPNMVMIPAGSFMMGRQSGAGSTRELPAHTVTLDAYYFDKFEVTKALLSEVVNWGVTHGYTDLPAGLSRGEFHPVHHINWYAAVKWCNARSERDGLMPVYYTDATRTTVYRTGTIDLGNTFVKWNANGFRLPTEAEWEKAARGGLVGNTYVWGTTIDGGDANYVSSGDPFEAEADKSTPAGYYDGGQLPTGPNRANGYGLFDVAGNVWEWCWDWDHAAYYSVSPPHSPLGPATGVNRIARGSSWGNVTGQMRVAFRNYINPAFVNNGSSFRSARRVP